MAKNTNISKGAVCIRAYFTDKKGVKHYASDYGLKGFPIGGTRKKKA